MENRHWLRLKSHSLSRSGDSIFDGTPSCEAEIIFERQQAACIIPFKRPISCTVQDHAELNGAGNTPNVMPVGPFDAVVESFAILGASIYPTAFAPPVTQLVRDESRVLFNLAVWFGRLANRVAWWAARVRRDFSIRRSISDVAKLDDRSLNDLGVVHRSQIESFVRSRWKD